MKKSFLAACQCLAWDLGLATPMVGRQFVGSAGVNMVTICEQWPHRQYPSLSPAHSKLRTNLRHTIASTLDDTLSLSRGRKSLANVIAKYYFVLMSKDLWELKNLWTAKHTLEFGSPLRINNTVTRGMSQKLEWVAERERAHSSPLFHQLNGQG